MEELEEWMELVKDSMDDAGISGYHIQKNENAIDFFLGEIWCSVEESGFYISYKRSDNVLINQAFADIGEFVDCLKQQILDLQKKNPERMFLQQH